MAAARSFGLRLWIMLRDEIDYPEFCARMTSGGRVAVRSVREGLPRDSGLN